MPEEEGEQQSINVAAVHIGVGHDNDPVVPQFIHVEGFAVFFRAACHSKGRIDVAGFPRFQIRGALALFYVQDFTP